MLRSRIVYAFILFIICSYGAEGTKTQKKQKQLIKKKKAVTLGQREYLVSAQSSAWRQYVEKLTERKTLNMKSSKIYDYVLYKCINRASICDAAVDVLSRNSLLYPSNKKDEITMLGEKYATVYLLFTFMINEYFSSCVVVTDRDIHIRKNVSPEILQKNIIAFADEIKKWCMTPLSLPVDETQDDYWVVGSAARTLRLNILSIILASKDTSAKRDKKDNRRNMQTAIPADTEERKTKNTQVISQYLKDILHSSEMYRIVRRFNFSFFDLKDKKMRAMLSRPQRPVTPEDEVSSGTVTPYSKPWSRSSLGNISQLEPEPSGYNDFYRDANIKSISIRDTAAGIDNNNSYILIEDEVAEAKKKEKKGFFSKYKKMFKKKQDKYPLEADMVAQSEASYISILPGRISPEISNESTENTFTENEQSQLQHGNGVAIGENLFSSIPGPSSAQSKSETSTPKEKHKKLKKTEQSDQDILLAYDIDSDVENRQQMVPFGLNLDMKMSGNKESSLDQEFPFFYYDKEAPEKETEIDPDKYAVIVETYIPSKNIHYAEMQEMVPIKTTNSLNKYPSLNSFHLVNSVTPSNQSNQSNQKRIRKYSMSSETLLHSDRIWKNDESTGLYEECYLVNPHLLGHHHAYSDSVIFEGNRSRYIN